VILKLDPRWPVAWRTPTSVQLGIDPPLFILEDVTETHERVLAALEVGVSEAGLGIVSRGRVAEAQELLDIIDAALLPPTPDREPLLVAISGADPTVMEIARALGGSNVHTVVGERAEDLIDQGADLAVVVGHYVLAPSLHAVWLRRDVPHLAVVFSDTGVQIGPVVEPGTGACLRCLELHRRDTDPAWPAVATQLLGRGGSAQPALLVMECAAAVARVVLGRLRDDSGASAPGEASGSLRIDAETGARTTRDWTAHPECGCLGIAALIDRPALEDKRRAIRGRRGSGWADAARRAPKPDPLTS